MSEKKEETEKKETTESKEIKLPYHLKLKSPIQFGDEIITELVINREPQAGDFSDMNPSKPTMNDLLNILSKITAKPRKFVIDKMGARDMYAGIEIINSFLPSSPETGIDN